MKIAYIERFTYECEDFLKKCAKDSLRSYFEYLSHVYSKNEWEEEDIMMLAMLDDAHILINDVHDEDFAWHVKIENLDYVKKRMASHLPFLVQINVIGHFKGDSLGKQSHYLQCEIKKRNQMNPLPQNTNDIIIDSNGKQIHPEFLFDEDAYFESMVRMYGYKLAYQIMHPYKY